MNEIEFYIEKLVSRIKEDQSCPEWLVIKITEKLKYEDGIPAVRLGQLSNVYDYQARFTELIANGYSWINLTALGVHEGVLVVGVELPSNRVGCPKPSVNISGFTNLAKNNAYKVNLING